MEKLMESPQATDLMATIHRVEGKLDVAIAQTQARVDEQGRVLSALTQDIGGLTVRATASELATANNATRLDMTERSLAGLLERHPPTWPAVVSTIVGALTFFMLVAGLIYLGPH
jgi:hypothetical protein